METNLSATETTEAHTMLVDLARGATGKIPVEVLVEHVLTVTADADWPVHRAAMQAVLRRIGSIKRDGLRVHERPPGRRPLGLFRTGNSARSVRPYTTLLAGVRPIGASCDCPDFLRASLGLCKHALTILDDIYSKPRSLAQACELQRTGLGHAAPMLLWDPIRPLRGAGDWLERIAIDLGEAEAAAAGSVSSALRKWFEPKGRGRHTLRETYVDDRVRRLGMVEDLLAAVGGRGVPRIATEPAVVALLAEERERLQHATLHAIGRGETTRALSSLKQRLYSYQREAVDRFLDGGRLLLGDDMGLGKTAQATAACHVLWETERVGRGLLIVPAALKPQWRREWASFTDTPIEVVDGSPAERRAIYQRTKKGFLLVNYEQLLRDLEVIIAWKPDLVVLDEAQRIKNWASKTATYVKLLQPRFRLVLTGTPMENRLDELASIYDWVDGFALEPKWRLVPWHVTPVDGQREIGGARNLDTLRARLAPTMLRRTRREVLDQLPVRTDTTVPVEMTPEQSEEHEALVPPIRALTFKARRRPLLPAEFLKLMQLLATQRIIANGMAQLRFTELWPQLSKEAPEPHRLQSLSTPKLSELRELLEHVVVRQQRKVVVFSQWRRMLELAAWATQDVLAAAGRRAVFFSGKEGPQRRAQNLVDLHDDPSVAVLFATDAGGVGLNLQKAASCCINIDLPWNPAVLEQRIGRIYRLGQKRPIDVYNLVTQGSIEERIAALVADKRALFSSLFDGSADEVSFERSGSFLSQLERVIEAPPAPLVADAEDDDHGEESQVTLEVEHLVAAADESADEVVSRSSEPMSEATSRRSSVSLPPGQVQELFASLRVGTTAEGGVTIEAPPEAAGTLAALFEGLAQMLRAQGDRH